MKSRKMRIFLNGLLYENPLLVLMLGICPALAVTDTATKAFWMGAVTMVTLLCTNIMASGLKRLIPSSVMAPAYMIIIAAFVCTIEVLLKAFIPGVYQQLGVYTSLVAVNCLIFERASMFARKNSIVNSAIDGLGSGLGYLIAITLMGMLREFLGKGTIFGFAVVLENFRPIGIFSYAPGAFFTLGVIAAVVNKLSKHRSFGRSSNKCAGCPAGDLCSESCLKNKKGGRK